MSFPHHAKRLQGSIERDPARDPVTAALDAMHLAYARYRDAQIRMGHERSIANVKKLDGAKAALDDAKREYDAALKDEAAAEQSDVL